MNFCLQNRRFPATYATCPQVRGNGKSPINMEFDWEKTSLFSNGGCSIATLDWGNFNYLPVVYCFSHALSSFQTSCSNSETMLFWGHHHHHHIVVHLFLTRYLSSASRISITFTCCKIQRLPGERFFLFDLMFLHVFG